MAIYQGAGGARFEITPPAPGSAARENFDAQLAKGEIVEVTPEPAAKPAPQPVKKKAAAKKAAPKVDADAPPADQED